MTRAKVVAALAALALVAGAGPAWSHGQADYYPNRWTNLTPQWFFDDDFPDGNKRARVRDGLAQWNGRNLPLQFAEVGEREAGFDPATDCPAPGNAMFWQDIPDGMGALAITWTCAGGGEIVNSSIVFDSSRSWYDGVGDAADGFLNQICSLPPGCENDLWSVASHEWGHMTGFSGPFEDGHFDPNADICQSDPGPQHTMCPFLEIGTERLRTLEVHDIHTFEGSY
ncbi:MAG TPA: hypothetical protein VF230_05815 [Acidimicrobiales bacterium]